MNKEIHIIPATLSVKPSPKKYYGVTKPGYESGPLKDRAFIAAWSGYPEPKSFVVINAKRMTAGNTWDAIRQKNSAHNTQSLEQYIIELDGLGFKAIEFDTARELFEWLADCEGDNHE